MQPTLSRHPRYTGSHATHAGTPPTLARITHHLLNSSKLELAPYFEVMHGGTNVKEE